MVHPRLQMMRYVAGSVFVALAAVAVDEISLTGALWALLLVSA